LTAASRPALGIPDLPLRHVAGGHGLQLLAGLECDIGDVHRRDVELVQCSTAVGIDLDRIDVAGAGWFDAGGGIGELHAARGIAGFRDTADRAPRGSRFS